MVTRRGDRGQTGPAGTSTELPGPGAVRGRLLTLREVAGYLRVSERTVRRLVAAARLPCAHLGSRLRFELADVLRFVAARKE